MDDRHARHRRRPVDHRRRPATGYRTPGRASFERLVREAAASLPEELTRALAGLEVRVAELPPVGGAPIPLAEVAPGAESNPPRLTLFRRPLEARAPAREDLAALLRHVLVHEVAHHLGMDDDAIEDVGWE